MFMLETALQAELERNMELAESTRRLIDGERDMLQGDVRERLVLHRFHTDVWDAIRNRGSINELPKSGVITASYQQMKEVNELITTFTQQGDTLMYSPLYSQHGKSFGRDHLLDILQERCETAVLTMRTAYNAVQSLVDRTCTICNERFDSETAREQHEETTH